MRNFRRKRKEDKNIMEFYEFILEDGYKKIVIDLKHIVYIKRNKSDFKEFKIHLTTGKDILVKNDEENQNKKIYESIKRRLERL